jgi:hypothetical protein
MNRVVITALLFFVALTITFFASKKLTVAIAVLAFALASALVTEFMFGLRLSGFFLMELRPIFAAMFLLFSMYLLKGYRDIALKIYWIGLGLAVVTEFFVNRSYDASFPGNPHESVRQHDFHKVESARSKTARSFTGPIFAAAIAIISAFWEFQMA